MTKDIYLEFIEKKYPIKLYDVCYKNGVESPEIFFQEEIKN